MQYRLLVTSKGKLFCRSDMVNAFKDVDAVVMDIDGTLVDTLGSYTKATIKTVNFFLQKLIGLTVSDNLLNKAIHKLRLTGGFNNDWDTTYAIIMGVLSGLSDKELAKIANSLENDNIPSQPIISVRKKDISSYLMNLLSSVNNSGLDSIEKEIREICCRESKYKHLEEIKRFLGYPSKFNESILAAVFDEIYYGSKLYSKLTGRKPLLGSEEGLIKNEKIIVNKSVLNFLKNKTNTKLGIVTGRPRISAEIVLKDIFEDFFKPEALIFFEDVLIKTNEKGKDTFNLLLKPDPYGLKLSLKALEPCILAAYVGDSVEDALMVQRANENGEKVVFIGVYRYTLDLESTIRTFMKMNAAAIIPTVNELKILLGG